MLANRPLLLCCDEVPSNSLVCVIAVRTKKQAGISFSGSKDRVLSIYVDKPRIRECFTKLLLRASINALGNPRVRSWD